jgi:hypothetical protein
LKKELNNIGIITEEEKKKKISSRDELREHNENNHNKMKQLKQGIWYQNENSDALGRFSTGKIKKNNKNN